MTDAPPDSAAREARYWDAVSVRRQFSDDDLRVGIEDLSDPTFPWLQFLGVDRLVARMFGFVGDVEGKRVLDLGCGRGFVATALALRGARVDAIDISPLSISIARKRAAASGVADRITFHVGAGEQPPFEDEAFDAVLGQFVMHHLVLDAAVPELGRVLAPGGRAGFVETLGFNPALMLARAVLPGRFGIEKASSDDEAPIDCAKMAVIRDRFPGSVALETPTLVFMRMGVYLKLLNNRAGRAALYGLDGALGAIKPLRLWSYYGLMMLERDQ